MQYVETADDEQDVFILYFEGVEKPIRLSRLDLEKLSDEIGILLKLRDEYRSENNEQ